MRRRSSTLPEAERWTGIIKPGRSAQRRRPPGRWRRLLFYLGMFAALVAVIGTAMFAYVQLKVKANAEKIEALTPHKPLEPMNVVVIGSDTRDVLTEEERQTFGRIGGRRADTIMLVHLDEEREQAVLVHFPRDLRVRLGSGKLGKINAAYEGGPDAFVDTIEQFTGLPVHHFVEVNFVGFRNIVNTLGGVSVYFEKPIRDRDSGLNVPKGCVELEGDQALAFVRVRKIDDDFERIRRQQLFVKLMMEKLTSGSTLLNPVKVVRLVNLFAANVTTDADLSLGDMKTLALRLRRFDASNVDMRVVPSSGARIGGVSYVIHNERQTRALFEAIRDRKPLPDYGRTGVSPIDPGDVRLTVLNGTSAGGVAARGAEELRTKGYEVLASGNADRNDYARTVAFFKEGNEEKARMAAAPYGAEAKPMPRTIVVEGEVALVLGRDYAEGTATPPPPPPPGAKAKAPVKPLVHACAE